MNPSKETNYRKGFLPYALAAFLVGIVGGLSTVLGPAFMLEMNLAYNNTTWSALAQAISTAACHITAPCHTQKLNVAQCRDFAVFLIF